MDNVMLPRPPENPETVQDLFITIVYLHQEKRDDPRTGMHAGQLLSELQKIQEAYIKTYIDRVKSRLSIDDGRLSVILRQCDGDYYTAAMQIAMASQDQYEHTKEHSNEVMRQVMEKSYVDDVNLIRQWALAMSHEFTWPMGTKDLMYLYLCGLGAEKLENWRHVARV